MTDEFEKWLVDWHKEGPGKYTGCQILESVVHKYRTFKAEQEPLAVLADRKGWWVSRAKHFEDRWVLNFDCETLDIWTKCEDLAKPIVSKTYAECEAKARAYLNGLTDAAGKGDN